jgi:hypothetical protein
LNDLEEQIRHQFKILPQKVVNHAIDSFVHRLEKCLEINSKRAE